MGHYGKETPILLAHAQRENRLFYLDAIPTPYRLGVFHRAAELWNGPFHIAFCSASEPDRAWDFDFGNLDVEVLDGWKYRPNNQVNPMSINFNPSVYASLRKFKPDVVILSGYVHPTIHLAALWCRMNKIPYAVASETSWRISPIAGLKGRVKRLITKPLLSNMAFGLPVGREAGDYLKQLDAKNAPMYYFPNTPNAEIIAARAEQVHQKSDIGFSQGQALRQSLGIPENAEIILFVGRLIDAKRPLDLIDAFKQISGKLPDAVLVFVGDGPLMTAIKERAGDDPRIICTGWIKDPAQTAALMAISSVMALPSGHEPWGAVVNEAMAAGTTVIASDKVGAASELIVQNETGVVFPVGDIAALAAAMVSVLKNADECRAMGDRAQAKALSMGHHFAAANLIEGARAAIGRSGKPAIPA